MRLLLGVFFIFCVASGVFARDMCLKCHKELYTSTAHRGMKCSRCHLSHVSKYKGLLRDEADELCMGCHRKVEDKIKNAVFVHGPVSKGACLRCHDVHRKRALARDSVKELCLMCHKDMKVKGVHLHVPFKNGKCGVCHEPHASSNMAFVKGQGKVCSRCHRVKRTGPHRYLKGYSGCVRCHEPHYSSNRGLLKAVFHKPYGEKRCGVCHGSGEKNVCLKCHSKALGSFLYVHNHLVGSMSKNICVMCHEPHVGKDKMLLWDSPERLCQSCHGETYQQMKHSLYVHPKWKYCTECHAGHGSNNPAMLKKGGNNTCVVCHKTQGKFTHPVGEKVKDPRNGRPVTCVTCHDTMGTNFKYNLRMSGEAELCIECHKNY